jgi:MFS family permease
VDAVAASPAIGTVPVGDDSEADFRPTLPLPLGQLIQIALYWFGINTIWGGMGILIQERVPHLVPAGQGGTFIAIQGFVTLSIAVIIQPTIGMISDYTISRWGRRKPYIAIGATLDVLFVIGVATSQTYISLVAFLFLLQFSSNFAQGPFQGYVPDLVPARQVGLASALVGSMQTLGFIAGGIIISLGYVLKDFTVPTIALGFVELATAVGTLLWVREGRQARERKGRSWVSIGRSAWGTDILSERSFVNLVLSRLMFLAGLNALINFFAIFLTRTFGFTNDDKALWVPVTQIIVAVVTVAATVPSARLSDRIGRKPVIYVACAIGGLGMVVAGLAPGITVFIVAAALIGAASGTFLAVDWALMTDIIPKAASGRYMGISNIAVASAGAVAGALVGPIIDVAGGGIAETGAGPRAGFLAAVAFFALSAFFLRRVDPRPRDVRLAAETVPRMAAETAPVEAPATA